MKKFLYSWEKKKFYMKFFLYSYEIFYNNLGIHALIIYFCFVLIDLINDYKNIYFRNNVYEMFFL